MKDQQEPAYGKRLLPVLIDQYAHETPPRTYASIPIDAEDISRGFRDISYAEFAQAINRAASWLDEHLPPAREPFETIAYVGPKDLVYPVLAVAAIKVGRKLLLPSPFATVAAQVHVLDVTRCQTYLFAPTSRPVIDAIHAQRPELHSLELPSFDYWFNTESVPHYPYSKSWEDAKHDPVTIFHTSGTTGLPKPITYTHRIWNAWDAWRTLPKTKNTPHPVDLWPGSRIYSPLPTLHVIGMMLALISTVHYSAVAILGPADKPATAETAVLVLQHSAANSAFLPPSLHEEIASNATHIEIYRKLHTVFYGGSPLEKSAGDAIAQRTRIQNFIGATEHPAWQHELNAPDEWAYFSFHSSSGATFEHRTGDLHELFFERMPGAEAHQVIFMVFPELQRFATKDLWAGHPSKPGLWTYKGRTDDIVVFSHGENLYVQDMESTIQSHAYVRSAVIGGSGRLRPILLLELNDEAHTYVESAKLNSESLVEEVWPVVERANKECAAYVRLTRKLVILGSRKKPLARLVKGSVDRRGTLELYKGEIDAVYSSTQAPA